jgi:UDP:flavonoid glycosyltransferase YjiC (YdhE family)
MRALANGCPLLCLPMGRDQNDNAARVVARGAGIRLTRDAQVPALRTALVKLLEDTSYARSAKTLGQTIAEAEPQDALADALERLVAEKRHRSLVA